MPRRRLRKSEPLPIDESIPVWDQPTIPANMVGIGDWRTDSANHAVRTRTSWGRILDVQRIAEQIGHMSLRFLPVSLSEIIQFWHRAGGPGQLLTRNPLLLARYSFHGAPPLILISVLALTFMQEEEITERLRVGIESAVMWLRSRPHTRGPENTPPPNVLLLMDCPPECSCPYAEVHMHLDDLDDAQFADFYAQASPPPR
jgi:hypothetical protein